MEAEELIPLIGKLRKTVNGLGVIKGANCTIKEIRKLDEGITVVFEWKGTNGTTQRTEILVPKGNQGEQGTSITGIQKTATSGLIDTYTITFSDGSTSTFQIKNGTSYTKLSELENDTGFITNLVNNLLNYYTKSETYNKEEIDNILKSFKTGLNVLKVKELPTTDISLTTIYLLPTEKDTVFTQWMYLGGEWNSFGDTTLDLSNVYTKEEIDSKLLGYVTATALETTLADYAKKADLAKVALSGSYNDLSDLPPIPELENDFIAFLKKLSEVNGKLYFNSKAVCDGNGGGSEGGASSWDEVIKRPFNTLSESDFNVVGGELSLKNRFLNEDKYASKLTDGYVKGAEVAHSLKILEDCQDANVVVGKNEMGEVAVYPIPLGVEGESKLRSYEFINITPDWNISIPSLKDIKNGAIISTYKFEESSSADIVIKEFNTINEVSLSVTDGLSIVNDGVEFKKSYTDKSVVNSDGFNEIDISKYELVLDCEVR